MKKKITVFTLCAMSPHRTEVVNLTAKNRLPAMYYRSDYVEAGGLMAYEPRPYDGDVVLFRSKKQPPGTVIEETLGWNQVVRGKLTVVEQPKKFEFIINLKAAKQIGLTIPPNVLARADRVIR